MKATGQITFPDPEFISLSNPTLTQTFKYIEPSAVSRLANNYSTATQQVLTDNSIAELPHKSHKLSSWIRDVSAKSKSSFPYYRINFSLVFAHRETMPVKRLHLRNEYSGFWRKAARGELLIGGVEAIGLVCLIAMPKEITKWEKDWIKAAGRNLKRAYTSPPVMDEDDWVINYIGHPVAGSYYYNAVRSQNAKWWESFLFSFAQSFIWEYGIEAVAEQPSIQDLISTPVLGAALGEPIHQATMAMRKNKYTTFEKVIVTIINPMFVFNNGYKSPNTNKAAKLK